MLRYLETFFRHRLLLTAPVGVVLMLSMAWVLVQPASYDSTVRLWTEKQTLVANPNDNPYITPAQEESAVLTELIATKYFCVKVGNRSPLAAYLASPSSVRPSLPQQLLAKVGLAAEGTGGLSGAALDNAVYSMLSSQTFAYPTGPEIVAITFRGGNPELSAAVAQAVADQFIDESLASQRVQTDAAVQFYTGQVAQSQAELSAADKAVDDYLVLHPEQRAANAIPDAKMAQLKRNDDAARQRHDELQGKLDQAKVNTAALAQSGASGIRVLDRAEVPQGSQAGKKVLVVAGGIGLAVGLLIVIVGVLVLTLVDTTLRRPEEVEQVLDLRPVGTVPRLS